MKEFQNVMTSEEKERLYKAIDYQENSVSVEYPKEYVATSCKFMLYVLEIKVRDEDIEEPVVTVKLENVNCEVGLRPTDSALK